MKDGAQTPPKDITEPAQNDGPSLPEHPPELVELAHRGKLTLGLPNDPAVYPQLSPIAPAGTAARLIDEDREDRF